MKPITGRCPDCWKVMDNFADVCCAECLANRRERMKALQEQGVGGQSCTDEMEDKMYPNAVGCSHADNNETRQMRSGARNGRIMRKGEIYGG